MTISFRGPAAAARTAVSVALLGAAGSVPALAQSLNTLSAAEQAAGFTLLWDGTSAGRSQHLQSGSSGSNNIWVLSDNALNDPQPDNGGADAFLWTKQSYASFEFKVDWKISAGGNSGIFPRQTVRNGYCSTYEFGILDDLSNHGDADDVLKNPGETSAFGKRTATVYDMYPTTEDGKLMSQGGRQVSLNKPAGQWNSGVIFLNGNYGEHWLNGKKVVDFEIGSAEWNARFAKSKFPGDFGCKVESYGRSTSGMIGFQDHGHDLRVWLRNLKIRSFTPGAALPKPTVSPEDGTLTGPVKVKAESGVTGAVVRYTLDGSDPTETSPVLDSVSLAGSATLKARTYRARFPASEVVTRTYTISGTSLRSAAGASSPLLARTSAGLRLQSRDGGAFTADLVSLSGTRAATVEVGASPVELRFAGLESGVYLLRMRAGGWNLAEKVLVP